MQIRSAGDRVPESKFISLTGPTVSQSGVSARLNIGGPPKVSFSITHKHPDSDA